ncbi:MAG: flagellar biosynthetic protein FliO [Desulfobulbus oligotrophicus]|jgi:flagellar protein FliO/FliZ|nr:flagellar biosynthetic protein FliO [Desulfobulbus oligotrophicus]
MHVLYLLVLTILPEIAWAAPPPTPAGTLFQTAWALMVVIGLILALYGLSKKRFFLKKGGNHIINVVEVRPIHPKSSLTLVEVRGREYLLGVGPNAIHLLAELNQSSEPQKQATDFSSLLAEHS